MASPASEARVTRFAAAAEALTQSQRAQVAEVLLEAAPDFYGHLPFPDRDAVLDAIAEQLRAPGGELADTRVLLAGERVVAAFSPVTGDVKQAGRESLAMLLRRLAPRARAQALAGLSGYVDTLEPLEHDGIYIARFAVAPAARGHGYGRLLGAEMIGDGRARINLHVHRDNRAAIALYERLGLRRASMSDYAFVVYTRPPAAPFGEQDVSSPCGA